MSPFLDHFVFLTPSAVQSVVLADDSTVPVLGVGDCLIMGKQGRVRLVRELYVPNLNKPLLSVPSIVDRQGRVHFEDPLVTLIFAADSAEPILLPERAGSCFEVRGSMVSRQDPDAQPLTALAACCFSCQSSGVEGVAGYVRGCSTTSSSGSWELWHSRLGHVGAGALRQLAQPGMADGFKLEGKPPTTACEGCLEGKMAKTPYSDSTIRSKQCFDLIHMDLTGPVEVFSVQKHQYVLVLVDDFSHYAWVYFLRLKSFAEERIMRWMAYVERQFECKVKTLRSDNGGEFLSDDFQIWLDETGVVHQLPIPYSPSQNGVAERYFRTLTKRSRSMLLASGLPPSFWEFGVRYACWCTNRVPSSAIAGSVPYTMLRGQVPNLALAKVFGCMAQVHVRKEERKKFSPKSRWGVFIGIPVDSKR